MPLNKETNQTKPKCNRNMTWILKDISLFLHLLIFQILNSSIEYIV